MEKNIIIIGAGLSGLISAYELQKHGHSVHILEADKRHIGGRVRTIRFSDGAYAEAGAMRIPTNHNLTRHYVNKFGLKLRPFIQHNQNAFSRIRGKVYRNFENLDYSALFDLSSSSLGKNPNEIWNATIGKLVSELNKNEIIDLFNTKPKLKRTEYLDQFSLNSWLINSGAQDEDIQLLASAWSMESSLNSALTSHLRTHINKTWINEFDEIVGGTDLLPNAIAKSLFNPVMQGCKASKIMQTSTGVSVSYEKNNQQKRIEGDLIICSLPLGPAREIEYLPPLSSRKWEAMRRVNYDSSVKILAHSVRRFWEIDSEIYGGGSSDDDVLGSVWYPNDNLDRKSNISEMPSAFIASYTWGQQARRIQNNMDGIRKALSRFHVNLASNPNDIMKLVPWSWDKFPYSKGAYAHFLPGEHSSLHSELLNAEGRLHFAGEHTSLDHAWMQGAIESALRVVQEIQQ